MDNKNNTLNYYYYY